MPTAFFARITNAGYEQYPDLMVVTPLPGFSPGTPPPRPTPGPLPPYVDNTLPPYVDNTLPQPPLGIWGPPDPRPQPPIVLPPDTAIPPDLLPGLPDPGEPGSPSNPYPPGEVPEHPATGLTTFYMVIPYVGVVGPFTMPAGVGRTPAVPPAVPDPVPPQAP